MSLQTFTREKNYTSGLKALAWVMTILYMVPAQSEWNVDFSRRTEEKVSQSLATEPVAEKGQAEPTLFDKVFTSSMPVQEIVVLNTDKGFVPTTLNVVEGREYKIHIVNVNRDSKNISFVLDAFAEHHSTYYGKLKSFNIQPKRTGVYTFVSPETSAQGKIVVHPPAVQKVEMRYPASE